MKIRKVYDETKTCPVGLKSFKPVKLMSAINKFLPVSFHYVTAIFFRSHPFCRKEKMPGIHVISKECQ